MFGTATAVVFSLYGLLCVGTTESVLRSASHSSHVPTRYLYHEGLCSKFEILAQAGKVGVDPGVGVGVEVDSGGSESESESESPGTPSTPQPWSQELVFVIVQGNSAYVHPI